MKVMSSVVNGSMVSPGKNNKNVAFGEAKKYDNPVNKSMEYTVATLGSITTSAIVGAIVGFAARAIKPIENEIFHKKAGLIAAGVTLALSLPATLYNASKKVFVAKNEMDVRSRTYSVEKNLSEKIDDQARNKEVPLEQSINNLAKFQTGRRGNGIGVINY